MNTLDELLTDTFIKSIKSTMYATYSRKDLKEKADLTICADITCAVPNFPDTGCILFMKVDDTIKKAYLDSSALIEIYANPKHRHELIFNERVDKLLGSRASDLRITNRSYLKALLVIAERKAITDLNKAHEVIRVILERQRAKVA